MIWLWLIAVGIVWTVLWVVFVREWLYCQPWAWSRAMFAVIEPFEIWLWRKSETILWSRFLMLVGALPVLLDQLKLLNIPALAAVVPPNLQPYIPLVFTVIGIVSELLRRATTKPLALVEVPTFQPVPQEVKAAVATSDAVKKEAVAVVKEAQKEGKL